MFSITASPFLKKVDTHYERGPIQVLASAADAVTGLAALIAGGILVGANPALGGTLLALGGFQLAGGTHEWIKLSLLSAKEGLSGQRITIVHKPSKEWMGEFSEPNPIVKIS